MNSSFIIIIIIILSLSLSHKLYNYDSKFNKKKPVILVILKFMIEIKNRKKNFILKIGPLSKIREKVKIRTKIVLNFLN